MDKSIKWFLKHILIALIILVVFNMQLKPKLWLFKSLNKCAKDLYDEGDLKDEA